MARPIHSRKRFSTIMCGSEFLTDNLEPPWYVLKGKEILGPFSRHVIENMVRDRTIGPEARVAPAGAGAWQPLSVLTSQAVALARTTPVPTEAMSAGQSRYAGFWIRVGAYLLDYVFIVVIFFIVFFVFGIVLAMKTGSGEAINAWIAGNEILVNLASITCWSVYEALFLCGRWQATPGKRICRIHVIHESGAPIGFGRAFARSVCYILDSLILFIGFMMAGWTREKTALHDLICRTRVVYGRPQTYAREVAGSF